MPGPEPQRIAKLLARAGIASRREVERMIAEGRVALNGVTLETPATVLTSLHGVTVDGNPVKAAAPARLFRFHKPAGCLTAERDPKGRPTIYDRLPPGLPRLMPVGRLDFNTEGLLLLTTDGGLKRELELPATGVERTYRARAFGDISQERLEQLFDGIEIDGMRYGPIDANLERRTGRNQWIEMKLREGKNREVRRVLEHLGLEVSRLIRTAYGPFELADLPTGAVDEVRQHDLVVFRKSLGSGSTVATERSTRRPAAGATAGRRNAAERRTGTRVDARADRPGRPPQREEARRGATAGPPANARAGTRADKASRPPRRDDNSRGARESLRAHAKDGPRSARADRPPRREDDPRGAKASRPSFARDGARPARTGRPPRREDNPHGEKAGRPSRAQDGSRPARVGQRQDSPRDAKAGRPSKAKDDARIGNANRAPQPGGRDGDRPRRGPSLQRRSPPRGRAK